MQLAEVAYGEDVKPNSISFTGSSAKQPKIGTVDKATQQSYKSKANEEDEFDLFGKTIALQLKKMPLDIAIYLQENIQSLINQERLKLFREHTTAYSECSTNELK